MGWRALAWLFVAGSAWATPVEVRGGDAALRAEVEAALAALPAQVLKFPGGPLELVVHAEPRPFGMGDGSAAAPEWSEGRRRYHLYGFADGDEPRASHQTRGLTLAQKQALWRRRAVVHAVMARWEDAHRFSEDPAWRSIAGWPQDGPAVLQWEGAFSRRRGMQSAALDFLTFAEEALVPVESLRADALPVDERVRCQEFLRTRVLRKALASLGAGWEDSGACPAYEAWADLQQPSRFEILFAEASAVAPESVFGHLLLRKVRSGPAESTEALLDVVEVSALVGDADDSLTYLRKGLTGGYATIFRRTTMASLRQRYLEGDQRSLRRFRLDLTPEESARLTERIWELERRGEAPYRFLTDNCASMLLFMLNGALEPGRQVRWGGVVAPAMALDALAAVDGLLVPEAEALQSSRARALDAEGRRDKQAGALLAELEGAQARQWSALWRSLRSPAPKIRIEAYRRWPTLMQQTAKHQAAWRAIAEAQVAVERYAVDRARARAQKLDGSRLLRDGSLPGSDELLEKRRERFGHESASRMQEELELALQAARALAAAPRRPLTRDERRALFEDRRTQEAYFALLRARATVPGPQRTRRSDTVTAPSALGGPGSGFFAMAAAPSVRVGGGEAPSPGLWLSGALLSERLGDQRPRGFGADVEVRALEVAALIDVAPEAIHRLSALRVDVFQLRSLWTEPRLSEPRGFGRFGRGFGAGYQYLPERDAPHRVDLHAEGLLPLWRTQRARGFGALGLGAFVQGRPVAPEPLVAGSSVQWLMRLPRPGSGASGLRAEAEYRAHVALLGSDRGRLGHGVSGTLAWDGFVRLGGQAFLVGPQVQAELETGGAGAATWTARAGLHVAWTGR